MRPTTSPFGATKPAGGAVTLCHDPSIPATAAAANIAVRTRIASPGSSIVTTVSAYAPAYHIHLSASRAESSGETLQIALTAAQSANAASGSSARFDFKAVNARA